MSRFTFAALASLVLTSAAAAQEVPGRDLLEFPLGLVADAPALSVRMTAGLWNPAASSLRPGMRGALGFAGLTTPKAQGVGLEQLGGEIRVKSNLTVSASFAQASVRDIFRTETDPNIVGGDIPYETSLFSAGAALVRGSFTAGLAVRRRSAQFDNEHGSVWSTDAGVMADSVLGHPLRVGASTFLFSPWASKEAATYTAAADYPVYAPDSAFAVRGGYSITRNEGRGYENYFFSSATYHELDANAGVARVIAFGHSTNRVRLGIGLRHAGYAVAFGSENGVAGIGASYQVILTRTFR